MFASGAQVVPHELNVPQRAVQSSPYASLFCVVSVVYTTLPGYSFWIGTVEETGGIVLEAEGDEVMRKVIHAARAASDGLGKCAMRKKPGACVWISHS